MKIRNVEVKARCADPQRIRDILMSKGARFVGRDHQTDTYYQASKGRLKLRRGNIENALIAYTRENIHAPKVSDVLLYKTQDPSGLHELLDNVLDTSVIVDKVRDIYFIGNVKFHVDEVKDLGSFAEIEAIDDSDTLNEDDLRTHVMHYMHVLGITQQDLLSGSYSDMIQVKE